jgi:hypothetical protein
MFINFSMRARVCLCKFNERAMEKGTVVYYFIVNGTKRNED